MGSRTFSTMGDTTESTTPDIMYGWRVKALKNWIKEKDGILKMEDFQKAGHLDQFHYLGLECNDDIIDVLQIDAGKKVLDVGSGIGGPARYISWKTGCKIVGLDIQENLVKASTEISNLLKMGNQLTFRACDATKDSFTDTAIYDAFYSILVFLHIPQNPRKILFRKLFSSLKDSGSFCIEDYCLKDAAKPFTSEEMEALINIVGAVYVPCQADYKNHLESSGFQNIEFEDLTETWSQWTIGRRNRFLEKRDEHIRMHGEEVYKNMETFYKTVADLFLGGRLAGVRITGSKGKISNDLETGRSLIKSKKRGTAEIMANVFRQI